MRTWIGVFVPEEIKEAIEGIQKKLKRSGLPLRWVDPSIAHLNLKFMGGAVNAENLSEVKNRLAGVARSFHPVTLFTGDILLGFNPERPRVLYWDLKGDLKGYATLAKCLEEELGSLIGLHDNRKPKAHITLARVKRFLKRSDRQMISKLAEAETADVSHMFEISSVCMLESKLGKDGPEYEVLQSYDLEG